MDLTEEQVEQVYAKFPLSAANALHYWEHWELQEIFSRRLFGLTAPLEEEEQRQVDDHVAEFRLAVQYTRKQIETFLESTK